MLSVRLSCAFVATTIGMLCTHTGTCPSSCMLATANHAPHAAHTYTSGTMCKVNPLIHRMPQHLASEISLPKDDQICQALFHSPCNSNIARSQPSPMPRACCQPPPCSFQWHLWPHGCSKMPCIPEQQCSLPAPTTLPWHPQSLSVRRHACTGRAGSKEVWLQIMSMARGPFISMRHVVRSTPTTDAHARDPFVSTWAVQLPHPAPQICVP